MYATGGIAAQLCKAAAQAVRDWVQESPRDELHFSDRDGRQLAATTYGSTKLTVEVRDDECVADVTGLLDLHSGPNPWPVGMRVIVRKERPQPGARPRITDADGVRIVALAVELTA